MYMMYLCILVCCVNFVELVSIVYVCVRFGICVFVICYIIGWNVENKFKVYFNELVFI